jgi:DnaJ-class molecular chaperone
MMSDKGWTLCDERPYVPDAWETQMISLTRKKCYGNGAVRGKTCRKCNGRGKIEKMVRR